MKIKQFKSNDETNEVEIILSLTDVEYQNFNITKYRRFDTIREDLSQIAESDMVIEAVFRAFDYPLDMKDFILDAKESGRVKKVMDIRRAIIYNLRKFTPMTIVQISNIFNLNHSMTIHHSNKFQGFLDIGDPNSVRIDREVERILDSLS